MGVTLDAWYCLPTRAQVERRAARDGTGEAEAAAALLAEREALIGRSRADPYRYAVEPGIWLVCDALLDLPGCGDVTRAYLWRRCAGAPWMAGVDEAGVWRAFKREMRRVLGFERPVKHLLISGTNRSGKSNYCVSRAVRVAWEYDWRAAGERDVRVYFMHENYKRVVEDLMALIWHYLPAEAREAGALAGEDAYLSYRPATGFSNQMLLTPNGVRCFFRSYEQDADKALEGFTAKFAVCEENVPLQWAERIFTRLSDKRGWYVQPFTPIHGWTPCVGVFTEGMEVVRWIPAYALPEDGGPVEMAAALGLTEGELEHVRSCAEADPPRQACCPRSRPEDCVAWVLGAGEPRRGGDLEGRRFEMMPRVARCADDRKAVVWFSPMDNPYSNAADVIRNNLAGGREAVLRRVYGVATKSWSARFARFDRAVHVVRREDVPAAGLNGFVADPAGTRNWAMAWWRVCGDAVYFYREFPSQRHPVPGAGVLGAWAVPDDRKGGQNDGRRGPGQDPLGWSYLRYKAEIARLEGWADYEAWLEVARLDPAAYAGAEGLVPSDDEVAAWDEDNGCPEAPDRIGDVRALSTPRQERDRFETMQTILDDVGLRLDFTDGVDIEEGVSEINHLLDFERSADGEGFRRRPRLFFSEDCVNLIEAMENWKGCDGMKGAWKDFVDLVRYAVLRTRRPEFRLRERRAVDVMARRAAEPGVGRLPGHGGPGPREGGRARMRRRFR